MLDEKREERERREVISYQEEQLINAAAEFDCRGNNFLFFCQDSSCYPRSYRRRL